MAAAFFGAGGVIVALAAGWIPARPAPLQTPRWVIASAAVMFIAGGFMPLTLVLRFPAWVNQLAGLVAASALGAVFNWVAFFPGERHFTGSTSMLGFHLGSGLTGELPGRIVFGLCALLIDAIVIAGLWRLARGVARE